MAAAASFDEESIDDNPLLQDFEFPPFDVLQPKHIRSGIRELLKKLEHDLIELELSVEPFLVEPLELSVEALWTKFVVPLEKIVNRLSLVWNIVIQLKLLKDSPELSSAIEEVQPEEAVKFELRLNQSKTDYNAFKAIRKSHDWETLSDARKRVVECQMKNAILNGVELEDNKRELLNKIEQDLTRLSQKFVENVMEDKKKFDEKLIIDKNHVVGFAPTFLELFAQRAMFKGHENANAENGPWILT
ncbi:hypothetical protein CMV_017345 [Castanea mollissima]|uniref:Oligopeptidase A N-terminal domain-containing protein n=1 Tax=Castanea mollissima TaxID=60419 RepID=A0A8J4R5Q4_9ROSI|nr:hypothetical protein CMV_017345 [Castanea mollissima]